MRGGTEERLRDQGARLARLERHADELGRRACRQEARLARVISLLNPAQRRAYELFELELLQSERKPYLERIGA